MNWYSLIGIVLAPFMATLLVALFARPLKDYLQKKMRESRLKRFLLFSWKV